MLFQLGVVTLASFLIGACQMAPTKLKTEVASTKTENRVIVDTRSALQFSSYHVSGSVQLNADDFLILTDPVNKIRKLDPDINQIIERLAKRGISPDKNLVLIGDDANSVSLKKWKWLLYKLNVQNIKLQSLNEYIKENSPIIPKAQPERVSVWQIDDVEKWLKLSDKCFVNYDENLCGQ